jgi:L-ascorbate metabolism protein UlaG (beta-lactamase superfamily)
MTDLVKAREKRIVSSRRFRDGKFHNTAPTQMMREPFGASMAWDFVAKGSRRVPKLPLPIYADTKKALSSSSSSSPLRLTWLGHSTVLIEIDGVRLLTDPVWGERASPVTFSGPKRFHRPPLSLADLPPVDAVVLSHDHYDHLCKHTVRALAAGASPNFSGRFITALGVGAHLERYGVLSDNITELDWGEGTKVADVDVTAVPAQHFSGRGPLDRNHTLWAGMVMKGPKHSVFFSGDTGATPEHKDIGASFGPFDVALFEIGAWHPSWGDIHLGALGAWNAFNDINARALLPVHWGTFDLGLHPWEEPAELLYDTATAHGAPLWTPQIGEPLAWSASPTTSKRPWWREVLARI